jgi:penicillin-binding protein 1A
MIVKTARDMGLRTPLADTPSLPIGAGEVTVLDHTVAIATFPNEGKAVAPHAVLEVRTANGEVVWRFDRDGPKPRQVIPRSVALDMNMMLNSAAEQGTGRRAMLDGVRIAGKTGTTNAHRDAWFVAFTGNLIAGVWVGNDDYQSMQRMTGGSLPAMTWQAIMSYAHQGVELRPIPGLGPNPAPVATPQTQAVASAGDRPPRPTLLTQRGAETLIRIERIMDEAGRKLVAAGGTVSELPADPSAPPVTDAFASAAGSAPARAVRKN